MPGKGLADQQRYQGPVEYTAPNCGAPHSVDEFPARKAQHSTTAAAQDPHTHKLRYRLRFITFLVLLREHLVPLGHNSCFILSPDLTHGIFKRSLPKLSHG